MGKFWRCRQCNALTEKSSDSCSKCGQPKLSQSGSAAADEHNATVAGVAGIVVLRPSGEAIKAGLNRIHSVQDLRLRVAAALGCYFEHVTLIPKDSNGHTDVLVDGTLLAQLPNKELIAVTSPVIYRRTFEQHCGRTGCSNDYTCNCLERIILSPDLRCTLISINNEDSNSSLSNTQVIQWDVLVGSYALHDGVVHCSWDVHAHRKFHFEGGMFAKPLHDSSWCLKTRTSSFKWGRIELPHCKPQFAQHAVISQLHAKADLLQQDIFAEIGKDDLRHFHMQWFDISAGVSAQLLKDPLKSYRQRLRETTEHAYQAFVIETDELPIAMAQAVCQWQRAPRDIEASVLDTCIGGSVGWDIDNASIVGVPLTVQLAQDEHPQPPAGGAYMWHGHHASYGPAYGEVDGKMSELLDLIGTCG